MDEKTIKDYIEKLKELDQKISDDDNDFKYVNDLISLMNSINDDVNKEIKKDINQNLLNIKIKKLDDNAIIPSYISNVSSTLDLYATKVNNEDNFSVTFYFGFILFIPKDYIGLIYPINGDSVVIIDSNYTNELQVTFKRRYRLEYITNKPGGLTAKLVILPCPKIKFIEEI